MAKVFRPLQSGHASGSVAALEFHQTSYGSVACESSRARQPQTQVQRAARALWSAANYTWAQNYDDIRSFWAYFVPDPVEARQRYLSMVMTIRMASLSYGLFPDLTNLTQLYPDEKAPLNPDPRWWSMTMVAYTGNPIYAYNTNGTDEPQHGALYRASSYGARRAPHPSKFKLLAYTTPEEQNITRDSDPLLGTDCFKLRVYSARDWSIIREITQTYHRGVLVAETE